MLTQENLVSVREEDLRKQKTLDAQMEKLKSAGMVALQEKYGTFKRRLKELLDSKQDLLQSPMSKSEVLGLSKEALKKYRKEFSLETFLVRHLQNSMNRQNLPLNPQHVERELFGRDDFWKFFYWLVNEKDLEKAALLLPDSGMPEAEREARIKALDGEISELEACLAKEMNE